MSNFAHRWRATWHPERYHGWGRTRRYFEGWYFKVVTADESEALAFIPGIAMNEAGEQHAFVQVMHGKHNRAAYHPFEGADFRPAPDRFYVTVGDNQFSADEMVLHLPDVQGRLTFKGQQSWPKMLGAPGIMGWYSFVPFMECFHGVVSLYHTLEGVLNIAGRPVDFGGGIGYIEKDWGRSFPRAYVWMQANHFRGTPPASLLASVAHIPWMGSHFIGFISGFWLDGRLYRFATYNGAKKHLYIDADETVHLTYQTRQHRLHIVAHQAPGVALASPLSGAMTGKINESLQARVQVELWEGNQRLFEGTSLTSGLEVAGDVRILQ